MNEDKLPRKPLVVSSIAAEQAWTGWLRENNYNELKDGEGHNWQLSAQVSLNEGAANWSIKIQISTWLTANDLIQSGALNQPSDARLLSFIGERKIPIHMKPMTYSAKDDSEIRDVLGRVLPEIREKFAGQSFLNVKKGLVHRWIDESKQFGFRDFAVD
jgi:hypothetical protein